MNVDNLIPQSATYSIECILREDNNRAIKQYISDQLATPNCDRIKLYFKKQKIQIELINRTSAITKLLVIGEIDQLLATARVQLDTVSLINRLDAEYNELIETSGLESIIDYFSL